VTGVFMSILPSGSEPHGRDIGYARANLPSLEGRVAHLAESLLQRRGREPLSIDLSFEDEKPAAPKQPAQGRWGDLLDSLADSRGSYVAQCAGTRMAQLAEGFVLPENNFEKSDSDLTALSTIVTTCLGFRGDLSDDAADMKLIPINQGHSRSLLFIYAGQPVALVKSLSRVPDDLLRWWDQKVRDLLACKRSAATVEGVKQEVAKLLGFLKGNTLAEGIPYHELLCRELVAAKLFGELGVPPAVLVKLPELGPSSVHLFLPDAINPLSLPSAQLDAALDNLTLQSAQNIALVHLLTLNQDAHLGNLLLRPNGDQYDLIPVDHSLILSTRPCLAYPTRTPCWLQWEIMDQPLTEQSMNYLWHCDWEHEREIIQSATPTKLHGIEEISCITHHCIKIVIDRLGERVSPRDLFYGMGQIEWQLVEKAAVPSIPQVNSLMQALKQLAATEKKTIAQFVQSSLNNFVDDLRPATRLSQER